MAKRQCDEEEARHERREWEDARTRGCCPHSRRAISRDVEFAAMRVSDLVAALSLTDDESPCNCHSTDVVPNADLVEDCAEEILN